MNNASMQSIEARINRAHEIHALKNDTLNVTRLHADGKLTAFETLHLLAAIIYALSEEDMRTLH